MNAARAIDDLILLQCDNDHLENSFKLGRHRPVFKKWMQIVLPFQIEMMEL